MCACCSIDVSILMCHDDQSAASVQLSIKVHASLVGVGRLPWLPEQRSNDLTLMTRTQMTKTRRGDDDNDGVWLHVARNNYTSTYPAGDGPRRTTKQQHHSLPPRVPQIIGVCCSARPPSRPRWLRLRAAAVRCSDGGGAAGTDPL